MKYGEKKFTVAVGSEAYRENWERAFGKKPQETEPRETEPGRVEVTCPCCGESFLFPFLRP